MTSSLSNETSCLCGVCLASETSIFDEFEDVCLGCVLLSSQCQSLAVTRRTLIEQLHNLPAHFVFLSSQGWQIQRDHESGLLLTDVVNSELTIRIKADYDKPRVGVWVRTGVNSGEPQGFVFITLNSSLQQLRESIRDQLGDITPSGTDHHYKVFHFLDNNGWPITMDQEVHFTVLDLLNHGSVHLFFKLKPNIPPFDVLLENDMVDGFKSPLPAPPSGGPPILSRESTNTTRSSVQSWPAKTDAALEDVLSPKQILISYVRAEASEQALNLKKKLTSLGYSVFLDVHEIKSGIDWQDSLNFAVRHCDVFVPLVTTRYGETQWTNREVKLADVLGKLILPVSFVEEWPPKVLAIQWATTQFIPWKPEKAVHRLKKHGKLDRNVWELDYVHKAAQQIAERLRSYKDRANYSNTNSDHTNPQVQRLQKLFSCPAPLPDEYRYLSENRKGNCLVVVSAHPRQSHFVQELRELFAGSNIELWSSTELEHDDSRSDVQLFSQESLRERILSGESEGPPVIASQLSDTSMDSEFLHKNNRFQEKADEAGVILVVLSKEFAMSKTCMQQIYYCEHRKKLIPIKYEDFGMPGWISALIGTGELEDRHSPNYKELLKQRVEDYVQGKTHLDRDVQRENEISHHAKVLQVKLNKHKIYTYISGGARFYNNTSKEICRYIGQYLAERTDICLVTGGFLGVGDKVARAYMDASEKMGKKSSSVLHILPKSDPKVFNNGMQREDKTFKEVSYGQTIFSGESVRDRESIVSRVFEMCILIEGGPGAAHEAEQFEWNDRIVIPVRCTGGAAGGKFEVPDKIFEIPVGVSERDWSILQDKGPRNNSPAEIGQAVANVVTSISDNILLSRSQQNSPEATKASRKTASLRVKFPPDISTCSSALLSPVPVHKNATFPKSVMRSYSREASLNGSLPFKHRFGRQESNHVSLSRGDTLILDDHNKNPKYQLNDKIQWASNSLDEIDVPVIHEEEVATSVAVRGSDIIDASSPIHNVVSAQFSVHSQHSEIADETRILSVNLDRQKVSQSDEGAIFVPGSVQEARITESSESGGNIFHHNGAAGDSLVANGIMACGDNSLEKMVEKADDVDETEDTAAPSRKRTRQSLMKAKPVAGVNTKKGTGDNTDTVVIQVKSKRKLPP